MKKNAIWGCLVSIVGIFAGLFLLLNLEKISGAEFVALSLGFAVIGLIITFSAEVQEFSIAGNGVKLKELRSEAEKTIEDLKNARTELFRFLIQKSIEVSGGFGDDSKVDERVYYFVNLFEQIENFDCITYLKIDIKRALTIIIVGQYNMLNVIHKLNLTVDCDLNDLYKPQILYIELKDEMIDPENFEYSKNDLIKGVDAYAKLYAIKVKLDQLEN